VLIIRSHTTCASLNAVRGASKPARITTPSLPDELSWRRED
jgi:hypothetical protein